MCSCGHHFPLHAEAWIALLSDVGEWEEHWADLMPVDVLHWQRPRPYRAILDRGLEQGLNEAVRTGPCAIGGRRFWMAVFDFRFIGGTLGMVAGERLTRAIEHAITDDVPFLLVAASGGARMQESAHALMQMAKVNGAVAALHDARVPYLSLLTYPTYGGTAASLALLADINIAEPGAAIGFTGPRVIEQSTHERLPDRFQTAEFQLGHGQVDMIVQRLDLRRTLALLHDLLT
jgi:acetyl-CoA carboxylase carboxyl transferase subunit beta